MRPEQIAADLASRGVTPAALGRAVSSAAPAPAAGSASFLDHLRESSTAAASAPVTFSAHAQERLRSRNIHLSNDDLARINTMTDRVAAKGGKQALFLVHSTNGTDTAMVVSVKNRVVITAVDGQSMRDNLFTNIDSAAIV